MSTWTKEAAEKAIGEIIKRAQYDKDFRQVALDNPNEAVKQVSGMEVPGDFNLQVLEGDPASDYTILLPEFKGDDLSDEELAQVAGGDSSDIGGSATGIVSVSHTHDWGDDDDDDDDDCDDR